MKSFFVSAFLGMLVFAACTRNEPKPAQSGFLTVDNTGASCSVKDISDCTDARGGLSCFSRCDVKPSENFCAMEKLNVCLDNNGGKTCYQDHCNSSVQSGPFKPSNGSGGLVQLPAQGYGYEAYDVEYMRYGQPKTIARIKELAIRVYNKTGYKIFVGDLSSSSGGNGGRHAGHFDGLEVDIATMGNTPSENCYQYFTPCYVRSAQMALVDEILRMGGCTSMLFNDAQVQNRFPGRVFNATGHDDHLHIYWHN